MKSSRKGRNFELYIHKELKSIFPDIHLSKWSGVAHDDPGDLYTKHILFDCKHVANFSENDIKAWYKKLWGEAVRQDNRVPVIILKKSGTRSINVIINIRFLDPSKTGLASFFWDSGKLLIQQLDIKLQKEGRIKC